MSELKIKIDCEKCGDTISKDVVSFYDPQEDTSIDVSDFSQTTWNCDCGESYSIGDIDIRNIRDI